MKKTAYQTRVLYIVDGVLREEYSFSSHQDALDKKRELESDSLHKVGIVIVYKKFKSFNKY